MHPKRDELRALTILLNNAELIELPVSEKLAAEERLNNYEPVEKLSENSSHQPKIATWARPLQAAVLQVLKFFKVIPEQPEREFPEDRV